MIIGSICVILLMKVLNAYEMFGRHLMQVPSVSAERAAAIIDHFPTVTA